MGVVSLFESMGAASLSQWVLHPPPGDLIGTCIAVQVSLALLFTQVNGHCIPTQVNGHCIRVQVNGQCCLHKSVSCCVAADVQQQVRL